MKYDKHCENSRYGQWYCINEDKGMSFLVLTNSDASQKLAFSFVTDLKDKFYAHFPNALNDAFATYNYAAEAMFIDELCQKYKREEIQVMLNAQKKVENTITVMKTNLEKMANNTEELKMNEDRSIQMKETGNQFLIASQEANKKFKRRFYKIIAVGVLALILVLWVLFGGSSKKE